MKRNNNRRPQATISEKSKAYYRKLMIDIQHIEKIFNKQDQIIKVSPNVEDRLYTVFEN